MAPDAQRPLGGSPRAPGIAEPAERREGGVVRYGLYVPNCGAFGDPRNVIRLAVDAEEAGWDGLFLWDHIASPLCPAPTASASSTTWSIPG